MAFYVGQLRRTKNTGDYMTNVALEATYAQSRNPFGEEDKTFKDFALQRINNQIFEAGITYYLRFSIRKIPQYFYSADNSLERYNPSYAQADTLNLSILLQTEQSNPVNQSSGIEGLDTSDQRYGNIQKIGTCIVPMKPYQQFTIDENDNVIFNKKINSDYSSFTFIFTPRTDKKYIVFRILRTTYDAIEKDAEDGKQGRTWLLDQFQPHDDIGIIKEVNLGDGVSQKLYIPPENQRVIYDYSFSDELTFNGECAILNNIKNNEHNKQRWTKIGYQGRPGSLIVVNNEPLRVGRSGIFEINNGIEIQSFKIAAPGGSRDINNIDAFLLDYAYTQKS